MAIRHLKDLNVQGKRVFCRVDFNVSTNKEGAITDDTRVQAALPTIKALCEQGAKVIVASHFKRPKGQRVPEMSIKPVAACLAGHLGQPVAFAEDCVGAPAQTAVAALKDGEVLLLENLRFHPGEETDDAAFARQLAELCDVYVNDAFGAAHRAHASVHALPRRMPERAAGLLMEKEVNYLGKAMQAPEHPFVVILGGSKVSGKLEVINSLLPRADAMLIGGGMVYTFLKAQGLPVGKSLLEDDLVETARGLLAKAKELGKTFLLPLDHVVTPKFEAGAGATVVPADGIPDEQMALDIGPETIKRYSVEIAKAKTIVWNGPQGVFELDPFHKGTFGVAQAVAASGATSIIGGGESVAAVNKAGVADQITHISTGGGASLEFLEGKTLPGVSALEA